MVTRMMIGSAVAALMISAAPAQTPANRDAGTSTPSGQASFVNSQKPEQWLASNFRGTDVVGADDKKIGDVSDILFDKDGKIEAYVVSVGGFLGMGAKDVALAPSAFQVVRGKNGESDKLKLSVSQDEIKQAENFRPYSPPRPAATTGSAPAGNPMIRPGGIQPNGR